MTTTTIQQADREKSNAALSSVAAAVFLTSMKIVVGLLTGSLGILSEAAHSGLDLVAAAVTFFAVRLSGKPADLEHPYGHGKIENLSALFETALLLVTCIWIIYEAILRLFFKSVEVEASIWAFVIMGISIIIDFSRSRLLIKMAKKYDSQALEADGLHFSTDIWSSSVVLLGLFLVVLSHQPGLGWLAHADAVAALGVAGIVVYVSLQLGRRTIADLLDAMPPGKREELLKAAHVPGVVEVRLLRVRRSGPKSFADVTVSVDQDLPLEVSNEIAGKVEASVQGILPGADVVVRTEPAISLDQGMLKTIRREAARYGFSIHKATYFNGDGERSLQLHVEVPETLNLSEAHQRTSIFEDSLRQKLPEVDRIYTHIEPSGDKTVIKMASPEDETEVVKVLNSLPEEVGVQFYPHDIQVRKVGEKLSVSFHVQFNPEASIIDAHEFSARIEHLLIARLPAVQRVVVHIEPGGETAG